MSQTGLTRERRKMLAWAACQTAKLAELAERHDEDTEPGWYDNFVR
jgi:hypothetical protein